ncbi:MAG TPA: LytTR family DNA-binding domain-containing protein [Puia sp.]|nr:LytTR family DNA-binding domain-containing protein [Puia sp.]
MINSLIIDDEKHCSENLLWQLNKYCPEIEVQAICSNAGEALEQIHACQPRLIFLDVEMPDKSGFDLLEDLTDIHFHIIFTTAFNQYALRAIKFGALDYLLKPIDKDELRLAVDKFIKQEKQISINQLTALLSHARKTNDLSFQKIAFPTLHSYELVHLNDILACESSSNYTNVRLANGKSILVSKTLKEIEDLLDMTPFFRVHHSWLVNLHYAIRYVKGDGGYLVLNNEMTIPVSRNKREDLLKYITHLSV